MKFKKKKKIEKNVKFMLTTLNKSAILHIVADATEYKAGQTSDRENAHWQINSNATLKIPKRRPDSRSRTETKKKIQRTINPINI